MRLRGGGMGCFSWKFWPRMMGVTANICSDCFCGVEPSLHLISSEVPLKRVWKLTYLRSRSNPGLLRLHLDLLGLHALV